MAISTLIGKLLAPVSVVSLAIASSSALGTYVPLPAMVKLWPAT